MVVGRPGHVEVHQRPAERTRSRPRPDRSGRAHLVIGHAREPHGASRLQPEYQGGAAAVHRQGDRAGGVLVDQQRLSVRRLRRCGRRRRCPGSRRPRPRRDRRPRTLPRPGRPPLRPAVRCRSGPRAARSRKALPPRCSPAAAPAAPAPRAPSRSPASSSDPPSASRAATGANRSRPWKVADSGSNRHGESLRSTARSTPPRPSAAGHSRPLSGPTRRRSPQRRASARRSVPTPGSTTARWTPAGMYGQRVPQHGGRGGQLAGSQAVRDVDHGRSRRDASGSRRGRRRRSRPRDP